MAHDIIGPEIASRPRRETIQDGKKGPQFRPLRPAAGSGFLRRHLDRKAPRGAVPRILAAERAGGEWKGWIRWIGTYRERGTKPIRRS